MSLKDIKGDQLQGGPVVQLSNIRREAGAFFQINIHMPSDDQLQNEPFRNGNSYRIDGKERIERSESL